MGTNAVHRGPTADTVAANVRRLRDDMNLGLRSLAARMAEVGRPLNHSALDKIEKGDRRVDVDDLMALAAALDVSPATLLMPDVTPVPVDGELSYRPEWDAPVEVTGLPENVAANLIWQWCTAQGPPRRVAENSGDFALWAARSIPAPYLAVRIVREGVDRGND